MQAMLQLPGTGLFGAPCLHFDSLPSTNQWALANGGPLKHGTVVVADQQVSGHGRLGRPWVSAAGKSLALSIILRHSLLPVPPANAGQLAAMAVRSMLEAFRIDAALKWPNDVMVQDLKIAGILAEQDSEGQFMVLGLGLNVNLSIEDLDTAGLGTTATSMAIAGSGRQSLDDIRLRLIAVLQDAFQCAEKSGLNGLLTEWRQYDWLTHRMIAVTLPSAIIEGTYAGIDEAGALLLRLPGGEIRQIFAGDVINVRRQRNTLHD